MHKLAALAILTSAVTVAAPSRAAPGPSAPPNRPPSSKIPAIERIARDAMKRYHLRAFVVQVRSHGLNVYTKAFGDSMYGVRATPQMHFRNGAMAFTELSTLLLEMVDHGKARLDDKLSRYVPNLPHANEITLKNLANMTSGYADYVYQPEVLHGVNQNPFRHWTGDELIRIGTSKPMMFAPGTNWGYSHTNYVILGRVLEKISGMPLDAAMRRYIFGPMGLRATFGFSTPQIPEPVLHAYSSERRADLGVKRGVLFYEESTFWDPSWTTAPGAVQVTDITDMSKTMESVGNGTVLSKRSFAEQVGPNVVGFGHSMRGCAACHRMTKSFNYGLGVVNLGPWVTQTKNFAGSGASVGYLRAMKLTVTVVTTYLPAAFDVDGNYTNASEAIFSDMANTLAPNTVPKRSP
ncbi:MAG: serine hydrolase [Candidatus Eremiobacteraeota bacterium]|nr:serine hydrolase [Candidatus Eremiobacteraeota bacterium]